MRHLLLILLGFLFGMLYLALAGCISNKVPKEPTVIQRSCGDSFYIEGKLIEIQCPPSTVHYKIGPDA